MSLEQSSFGANNKKEAVLSQAEIAARLHQMADSGSRGYACLVNFASLRGQDYAPDQGVLKELLDNGIINRKFDFLVDPATLQSVMEQREKMDCSFKGQRFIGVPRNATPRSWEIDTPPMIRLLDQ